MKSSADNVTYIGVVMPVFVTVVVAVPMLVAMLVMLLMLMLVAVLVVVVVVMVVSVPVYVVVLLIVLVLMLLRVVVLMAVAVLVLVDMVMVLDVVRVDGSHHGDVHRHWPGHRDDLGNKLGNGLDNWLDNRSHRTDRVTKRSRMTKVGTDGFKMWLESCTNSTKTESPLLCSHHPTIFNFSLRFWSRIIHLKSVRIP